MKCPKCQYISFDSPDRCRNCGYDFSLAPGTGPASDPPLLQSGDTDGPWPELSLADPGGGSSAPTPRSRTRGERLDLPLFNEPIPGLDDTPLITAPSAPRPPLAVRKATPDPSRGPRPPRTGRPGHTDLSGGPAAPEAGVSAERAGASPRGAEGAPGRSRAHGPPAQPGGPMAPAAELFAGVEEPGRAASPSGPTVVASSDFSGAAAPPAARLIAGAIDGALLLAIDLAVLHFTLAILRYPWSRLVELPLLPLAAFCLMLDAGYVIAFTVASGQTIGKMLTRVRVVTDESWRVPVAQAVIRTALVPVSVLTLGLGYLPALVGSDRRALHDRLSNTRVVRA